MTGAALQEAPKVLEVRMPQQEAPEGSSSNEGDDRGGQTQIKYRLVQF
jgi:hypothetical protein